MGQKCKNIVLVVTLDTKGEEASYLRQLIRRRGHNCLVIDVGIGGLVPFQPDFTREEVALATGRSLEEIRKSSHTHSDVLAAMAMGARSIIQNLIAQRKIDGLLSIGGGLGTTQASKIMPELPLYIPKLILSTVAFVPGAINSEMVSIDQTIMQSPSDLWGLNSITKIALQRVTGAICGMAEEQEEKESEEKPRVAISTLGLHAYVDRCKSLLLKNGYEAVVFHSIGTGGLEKLVRQGYFRGTLDLSCYELVSYVCGGIAKGGEEKFTAACEKGIPQVISSGGLDFFPLFASQPIPAKLRKRITFSQGMVNLIKTHPKEQEKTATLLAEKINKARAPTVVLVPLRGFSKLDSSKEMPFYEPGAGRRFAKVLEERVCNSLVEIEKIEAHINDTVFAERATALLLSKMR
jgi:uncharacterized protein (UPF0261 family)